MRPGRPIYTSVPVGFGPADFASVCNLMHGIDPELAAYPDLICPSTGETMGTSAKKLTDESFDEDHLRIGAGLFGRNAFDQMKVLRSQAIMMSLASEDQTVQIFFERR